MFLKRFRNYYFYIEEFKCWVLLYRIGGNLWVFKFMIEFNIFGCEECIKRIVIIINYVVFYYNKIFVIRFVDYVFRI